MVERRIFSVYNSAENPNMSWKDLAYMAMRIMNAELSNYNIISIQEKQIASEAFVYLNADLRYTKKEYQLVVFCERIS